MDGKYPSVMREKVDSKSQAQGFENSRLPKFTDEQSLIVAKTSGTNFTFYQTVAYVNYLDFLGINFYTSEIVYPVDEGTEEVSYHKDDDAELYQDESWFTSSWIGVTPWGLRSTMNWIKHHYPGVDVYVTENGVSDRVIKK